MSNEHFQNLLTSSLSDGSLALFLGAGTSKTFGLPNWLELINALRIDQDIKLKKIINKNLTAKKLQAAADEIVYKLENKFNSSKAKDKLKSKIEAILYKKIKNIDDKSIFKHELLIALITLILGKQRGCISKVITLNYDSMLEWYLSLFGVSVQVISELPYLNMVKDVTIYHPHGYIPHPDMKEARSDTLILSMSQANTRLGDARSAWYSEVKRLVKSHVFIFIGMSEATLYDRLIGPILQNTFDETKRELGVWLILGKWGKKDKEALKRYNIEPIEFSNTNKMANYILNISRNAVQK